MLKALGRILLSIMFINGGFSAFSNPGGRVTKVESAGIPQPRQATILNGLVMTVGGLMLAIGIFPKLASLALIGSLVPTTFVGHPYWQEQDAGSRANQQIQFTKNLAMIGGLISVLFEK